jgi:LacI family transcriptional regulator
VVGFDDMEFAAGLAPGLTTVALPHHEMGAWGVRKLLALIDSPTERAEQVRLCGELVRRRSVAPPPPVGP